MILSFAFLVLSRLAMAFQPSVEERCLMLEAVLNSQSRMALQGGGRPRAVDMPFPNLPVVEKRTRYKGRIVVRAEWREKRGYRDVLPGEDVCHQDAFLLEKQQGEMDQDVPDLVVLITLTADGKRASDRFGFEEGLTLNRRVRTDPSIGGIALPRMRYRGTIERKQGGTWVATVVRASFAY